MMFGGPHDLYRILGDASTLSVLSAGGSTVSTATFGPTTYAVRLVAAGSVTSTSGVRVKVISPADSVVSSTLGTLLPVNFPDHFKVTPGQRVSAIGNDGAAYQLVCTELE